MQGRELTVAGGHMIPEDDVAGLLAAQHHVLLDHHFLDVLIAHIGAEHLIAVLLGIVVETNVAHNRCHKAVAPQVARLMHRPGNQRHDLIAVYLIALFVYGQAAIGIAVEGNAYVIAALVHPSAQLRQMGRAAVHIDIGAIGPIIDVADIHVIAVKQPLGRYGSRTVGAVHQYPQVMGLALHRGNQVTDIEIHRVAVVIGHADVSALFQGQRLVGQHIFFNGILQLVRQLCAVGAKELDAVILIGIVGGGNHHAGLCLAHNGSQRHCGGGDHAQGMDIGATGRKARNHGALQHIRRNPGILADDHHGLLGFILAQHQGRRLADTICQYRVQLLISNAANAVCSE